MASTWRTLHLTASSIPQLLVKATLDSSGYTVHLTDLSRVWGETLTKREIRKRADRIDCAIDPSEGDDQFKILQEKIEQALGEAEGTGLSLRPTKVDGEDGGDGLVLGLTAPLPSPLPEFKWELHLTPLPAHHIETSLVTPLLHQAQNQQAQIRALIHELHEKDRVISKITDRLETGGGDLTTVFPGVSHVKVKRNAPQREQLAKFVSGLGDFDEGAWGRRVAQGSRGGGWEGKVVDGALEAVLRGLPQSAVRDGEEGEGGEWWRELGEGVGGGAEGAGAGRKSAGGNGKRHDSQRSPSGTQGASSETAAAEDVDMQDDEFQRQGTPPHLRHHEPEPESEHEETQCIPGSLTQEREPPAATEDESTTEDDDDHLDAPPRKPGRTPESSGNKQQRQRQRQRTKSPDVVLPTPKKVGAIGGRKKQTSSTSPAKQPSPEQEEEASPPKKAGRSKLGAIGGKAKASATPEPASENATSPAKPRAKLGAIGGKRDKANASATPEPTPTPSATSAAARQHHHKLGTIGGKKAADTSSRQASEEPSTRGSTREPSPRRSRQPERKEEATPPSVRETSQERADRKRGELKRQLEEKARAPVKKKRKF
ncbi:hypothetical protein LTR85_003461 [Meristemomyces frigidus]|nr:hypothetical protein LTR85_003461 [Meristemomyces frigidus]